MKVLLTSVFGPFGVDDEFGRKFNVMELFHNQVTREQGIFSLRMNHPSFGLYMIAENLVTPAAVLDFPTFDRFVREVKKGYDYIGISFIVANFAKAKKMVEVIRELSPSTKIVLGGHGTGIPGIESLIAADFICKGEGIAFFRELLGEPTNRPINHPSIFSTLQRRVMGLPQPDKAAVLIPGLGCVNACSFCATSHHFGKQYIGYLNTGKQLVETMQKIERDLGSNEFFVMDENFLKNRPRAEAFLEELEKTNKFYYLGIFSSAETINAMGVEFLAKIGVDFVWIGVESKRHVFTKTKGVDLKATIRQLRDHGIQVLASAILFFDHHDHESIQEDIDFAIELETDFVQFMELGPLPGTALYQEYDEAERLRLDVPFVEWHGQDKIWFKHPYFDRDETPTYLRDAFRQDYERQGPSLLRLADTSLRGYRTFKNHADDRLRRLTGRLKERSQTLRMLFPAIRRHAENQKTIDLLDYLERQYLAEFGAPNMVSRLASSIIQVFAWTEALRIRTVGNMRQPPTKYMKYRMEQLPKLSLEQGLSHQAISAAK